MLRASTRLLLVLLPAAPLLACDDSAETPAHDAVLGDGDVPLGDAAAGPVEPEELMAPGPWGVGFRTLEVTYRPETFDEDRALPVSIWYPTADQDGEGATYAHELIERPDVLVDASPAGDDPLPLLVFSHGNGGFPGQSFFLTEHLASHGWVVVAPGHTGNTVLDMSLVAEAVLLRPQDISAVLDAVEDLPGDDPLAGRLSDDVAMAGHSFGGYTTLAIGGASYDVEALRAGCEESPGDLCEVLTSQRYALLEHGFRDARVRVLVPMAPSTKDVLGPGSTASVDAPTLLLTGALDGLTPNDEHGDPLWEGLEGSGDLRVDIATAGHFTFSNACEIGLNLDDGCGDEYIPFEDAYDIVRAYSLGFLRHHLLGHAGLAPLLEGEVTLSDEVALSGPSLD
ncbi:MAG: alpha/beta hydrolase family protein [Myxococcota bacterium]